MKIFKYFILLIIFSLFINNSMICSAETGTMMTDRDYDLLYENLSYNIESMDIEATHLDGVTSGIGNGVGNVSELSRLNDGNLNIATWVTDRITRFAKITFTFKKIIEFNKIIIHDFGRNTKEFILETSTDGINWTPFYHYNDVEHVKYCYFPTQNTKYMRMNITDLRAALEGSMFELELTELEIYNVSPVEFYRLDKMTKQANDFLTSQDILTKPYFPERIVALRSAVAQGEEYRKGTELKQEIIESHVLNIKDKYLQVTRDLNYPKEVYEKVIYNWKDSLTAKDLDWNDEQKQIFEQTVNRGETLWNTMVKDGSSVLWESIGSEEQMKVNNNIAPAMTMFENVLTMATVATHKYSRLKGNPQLLADLEYALGILTKYYYGNGIVWFGLNVWYQKIGFQLRAGDIAVLLYGEIDETKLKDFCTEILSQLPPDYMLYSGTNAYDTGGGAAKMGAILGLDYLMENIGNKIQQDLVYKTQKGQKDGYYTDGSYVFHEVVPYVGTYGAAGYAYFMQVLRLLNGTPWIPSEGDIKDYLVNITYNAYVPVMQKGYIMSMVCGRAIINTNVESGNGLVVCLNICDAAYLLDEPYKSDILSYVKSWLLSRETDDWKRKSNNANLWRLMMDDSIVPKEPLITNKVYAFADRIVHRRPNYTMGLAMYSKWISRFENTAMENRKGWFTGSGMTYFYDDDLTQYSGSYFLAADMMRMPGVTAVNKTMPMLDNQTSITMFAKNDYAGGVSLDKTYGAAGFEPDPYGADLKARKSYFMFDDEVVMLGSNINSGELGNNVETTIDQRSIKENDADNIMLNGVSLNAVNIQDQEYQNIRTAHIDGRTENSKFGYYFPTPETLSVNKGTYSRLKTESSTSAGQNYKADEVATNTFGTLFINHGKAPDNGKYAYVVLPGKKVCQTENYAKNPDIEILANTSSYHAVQEKKLRITGMVNFENKAVTAGKLSVDKKSCLMLKRDKNKISFAISDPTFSVNDKVNVTIDEAASSIISKSDRIFVKALSPQIQLEIDMADSQGQSLEIELKSTTNYTISDEEALKYQTSFTDIAGLSEESDITFMTAKGIINGINEEFFAPQENLTRAQMAVLIVKMLNMDTSVYNNAFYDVNESDWYAQSVTAVTNKNYMVDSNGYFRPLDFITREEMCKIIAEVTKRTATNQERIQQFTDETSISDGAKQYVEACLEQNLFLEIEDNLFLPQQHITRAETAVLLKNIYDFLK